MLRFIGGFLLAAFFAANTARAAEYNQWQLMPSAKTAAAAAEGEAGAKSDEKTEKKRRKRVSRIRLVNVKDDRRKFIIACRIDGGRLQMTVLTGGNMDKNAERSRRTALSLLIDGKPVVKDKKSIYRRAGRDNAALRIVLQGDDMTRFISRFLTAEKTVSVVFGNNPELSYSAANAAQAGLALQKCLHK